MRFIIFFLMAVSLISARAESWTNTAGHAVSAELVSRKDDVLIMKSRTGSTFTIHYKALSKECQKTVDKKFSIVKQSHDEVVKQRQEQRMKLLKEKRK